MLEYLRKILEPKKRTLLFMTEIDINNLSASQILEYNKDHYKVILCSTTQLERVHEMRGLKIAGQFRQGNIFETIAKWEPERIQISDRIPDASKVEMQCTRAFLDAETERLYFEKEERSSGMVR